MFYKVQSDKNTTFVNNLKLAKEEESKTTPQVNVKISEYDKVVQVVTNDNTEIKPPQEEPKKEYI